MNFFRAGDLLSDCGAHCGDEEIIGVRPEHLRPGSNFEELVAGRLDLIEQLGEYALACMTKDNGTEFVSKLERPPEERPGADLRFTAST